MKTLFNYEYRLIAIVTLIASFVFSVWGLWADDVINNDGVEYLRAAELFKVGDWRSAIGVFKWPLYPVCIAAISTVTGVGVEFAAHAFNAVMIALVCLTFIAVVIELGADFRTTIAAAAIIILAKLVNDYRPFIIRDPAYLAFYLLAALYLFRLHNHNRASDALKALGFGIIATLFRIEGAAFLVLIPMLSVSRRMTGVRQRLFVTVLAFIGATALMASFMMWFLSLGGGRVDGLTASDVFTGGWEQVVSSISDKLNVIKVELLLDRSGDYAWSVLLGTLFLIVSVETLKNVTIWSGFLVVWAAIKRLTFPNRNCIEPWIWLIVVNLGVLVAFTLVNLFLTGRYTLSLSLTLLLAAPFGLLDLYERWRRPVAVGGWFIKFAYPIIVLFIVVSGIEGLGLGTNKRHIKDAGHWIAEQTDESSTLFTNNKILAYYTGKDASNYELAVDWRHLVQVIAQKRFQDYDTVAVRVGRKVNHRAERLVKMVGRQPDQMFVNSKNDLVFVYRNR